MYPGRWLQTPGIPHGSLTRRSWTLQACLNCKGGAPRRRRRGPNRFIHYSNSSLNAQSGSKRAVRSARGRAGGARDGEWAKERREEGEGQIPGEHISHRSRSICVIRKEITASDEGKLQRDTYHLPLHCERRITGGAQQKEMRRSSRKDVRRRLGMYSAQRASEVYLYKIPIER